MNRTQMSLEVVHRNQLNRRTKPDSNEIPHLGVKTIQAKPQATQDIEAAARALFRRVAPQIEPVIDIEVHTVFSPSFPPCSF